MEVNVKLTRPVRDVIDQLTIRCGYDYTDTEKVGALQRLVMPCLEAAAAAFVHTQNHRRVQGRAAHNQIPVERATVRARPAHLHRPWPRDVDFRALYEEHNGSLNEADVEQPASDALEGKPDLQEVRRRAVLRVFPVAQNLWPLFQWLKFDDIANIYVFELRCTEELSEKGEAETWEEWRDRRPSETRDIIVLVTF